MVTVVAGSQLTKIESVVASSMLATAVIDGTIVDSLKSNGL